MQVMFDKINYHYAIRLLLKDLVARNKDIRHDLILRQMEETISMKWIEVVQKEKCWHSPVKCTVRFRLNDEPQGSHFTMSTKIDGWSLNEGIEDYANRVFVAVHAMSLELNEKYDLDQVVFDALDACEAIDIVVGVKEVDDGQVKN